MLKIVADTNVLNSGLLGSGPSSIVLDLWRNRKFVNITSTELLDELITTLQRPKIAKRISETDSEALVELIEERSIFVNPKIKFEICRDHHDDKLLECAVEGKVDIIGTGDGDLLILHPFRNIDILTPSDLIKRLKAA